MYPESRACFERYVELIPDDERGYNILAEVPSCTLCADFPHPDPYAEISSAMIDNLNRGVAGLCSHVGLFKFAGSR